jgi:CHAT domain-containing protein
MRFGWLFLGVVAAAISGCETPPPEVYTSGPQSAATVEAVAVGNNQAGEPCRYQVSASRDNALGATRSIAIRCGSWEQPSARIFEFGGATDASRLRELATTGRWRVYVDERFACDAPVATQVLDGAAAQLMQCRRRSGGWPHLALTAVVNGRVFAADGVSPALPAIEATLAALGGTTGFATGAPRSAAARLIASRSTDRPFGSGDEGRYHELMALGDAYNNVDDRAHGEQAFREALAVQQHFLAADNPGLALTMMKLAAEISHQRKAPEADRLLERAQTLTARANDPLLAAQLAYYRAVTAAYEGNAAAALQLTQTAEQAFTRLLPPGAAAEGAPPARVNVGAVAPVMRVDSPLSGPTGSSAIGDIDTSQLNAETSAGGRVAITGLAEAMRLHANLIRAEGYTDQSTALAGRADRLLAANGLAVSSTGARSLRLLASNDAVVGDFPGAGSYSSEAGQVFERVVPGERPDALNALYQGAYRVRQGDTNTALVLFRRAGEILRKPTVPAGAPAEAIYPWLDLLHAEGDRNPADRLRDNAEMFEAAQLAKGNLTAQQIAEAAARLAADDPKTAGALRLLQQKQRVFAALARERDDVVAAGQPGSADRLKEIDERITAAQRQLGDAETEVQELAPRYRRTIEEPVTESDLRGLLQPDEALVSIFVAPQGSYGFLLERDRIFTYKIAMTSSELATMVQHLRESLLLKAVDNKVVLPEYDTAAAYRLYVALLGPIANDLEGKTRVTIAPSGALLSFPLEALVTEPSVSVSGGDYRKVPWLLRRFAVNFIPAPRTFVDLRRIKGGSPGTRPFIGFGDFRPANERQIGALFPPDRCGDDNRNLHLLGRLEGTKTEVVTIGRQLGAQSSDIFLADAFTKPRVTEAPLGQYRIIHLATHALLPAELGKCQTEPAILTSVPGNAPSADVGFLRPKDIEKLKLDADLVVLSACDTAGPGDGAGESLSGLAQAFFRAGTRGMLVTHWAALDVAAMRLMTGTLAASRGAGSGDTAEALRQAKLHMIDGAGSEKDTPLLLAHPFAWAPFVLIGEGVRSRPPGSPTASSGNGLSLARGEPALETVLH